MRVRFAPSPTGYLHVGGARTALFNWLFAHHNHGVMILRIEDTDAERNKPELVQGIVDGLRWLGVDWDEGPFYQSQRTELYRAAAQKCLANGSAFLCYCPAERYAGGDHAAEGSEGETKVRRVVRCSCRDAKPSHPEARPAIRFKVPAGKTVFFDAVFGEREFLNDEIEDFVILRSPRGDETQGLPTYQLGAVVDDIDMRITHVIRGADHISNTPKQVLLYRALGAEPPVFAHVPLILGSDKSRLSKRHGATDVNMYRTEGFLPEAFRNFLALLGWAPGTDEQFLRTSELLEKFSLEGVSRTNGVFDRPKLEWFNTQYLQKLPIEELLPDVENELKRSGLWKEEWAVGAAETRMVCEDRRFATATHPPAPGFFLVVTRLLQRRIRNRSGSENKILEGSERGATVGETGGCSRRATGLESRRLRSRLTRRRGSRGREGRLADQCHPRGNRRPSRGAAAIRYNGRVGARARSESPARSRIQTASFVLSSLRRHQTWPAPA